MTNHDAPKVPVTVTVSKALEPVNGKRLVACVPKEIDGQEHPFRKSAVAGKIDLDNCTYFIVEEDSYPWLAIMDYATQQFSNDRFRLRGGCREYERNLWEEGKDDDEKKPKGSDMESESDKESDKSQAEKEENKEEIDHEISTRLELDLGVYETTYRSKKIVLLIQQIGNIVPTRCGATRFREMVVFTEGRGEEPKKRLQQYVEMLLRENTVINKDPPRTMFKVYRWSMCQQYWKRVSKEKSRKMNSVILPEGFKALVEKDMERFLSATGKEWYSKYCIPYKRSYLFYGLPGTGKTSLITALAGRFERNVCFLAAHHPGFTDETFSTAIRELPPKAIVVLEDIDSLFDKERNTMNQKSPLTFTGLLNGLDGIGEPTGTIFIMTTNFIDRLDPALIRAGRVDMKVKFNAASDEQLEQFFLWFQEKDPKAKEYAPLFVKAIRETFPGREVTMAELQGHFIDNYQNDAKTCVENVKDYQLDEGHTKLAIEKMEKKREADKKAAEKAAQKANKEPEK